MYILIDRQQMAITHKHSDRVVLAKLAWLECTNNAATVPLSNARVFNEFTPLELKMLYKNATGAELTGYSGLANAVYAMANRLPESVVNAEEVIAQAACVRDGDKSCYQYAPGQKTPMVHTSVFTADPLTCQRSEAEELLAKSPGVYVPAHGTAPASPGFGAQVQQRAPAAPRTGGSRDTIFKVADDMWNAAGSPKDTGVVLALRKKMMVELEENHAIKKTTSSTALGDWMKARLG